jgi:uncharacterized ferritin-like protein (DUF455 family)
MLEFGEANTLFWSYRTHLREKGKEFADQWVKKALSKSHKGYNMELVRQHMRSLSTEYKEMENANNTAALRAAGPGQSPRAGEGE